MRVRMKGKPTKEGETNKTERKLQEEKKGHQCQLPKRGQKNNKSIYWIES